MRSQTPSTPPSDRKLPATTHIRVQLPHEVPPVAAPQSLPAEIQLDYSNMDDALHLPVQLDTLTEILQERLAEMTNKIDRREQQLTDKLQQPEARMHKSERKTAAERQSHRHYIDKTIKRLEDWEENLLQREHTFERNSSMLKVQYERYTNQYAEWQQQAERTITAWHEVAQTTLKENLDKEIQQHMDTIADFATNQEQQLVSLLDGYEEHARGIQAKLLARFHADLSQTYKEVTTSARQQEPIPVDDDDPSLTQPPSKPLPSPSSAENTTPPVLKTTRWINVNHEEIRAGHQHLNIHHPGIPSKSVTESELQPTSPDADDPQRTESTSTNPTPLVPKYPAADYHQLARLRAATTPSQLRGRDRKSVCIFYNSFVDFNRIYRIPLKILDDIRFDRLDDEDENLYPADLREQDPQLYDDYSSDIYARLEEEGVLDPQDPLYKGMLEVYNSRRDGYALLKGILAATVMVQSKDLGALSTPP